MFTTLQLVCFFGLVGFVLFLIWCSSNPKENLSLRDRTLLKAFKTPDRSVTLAVGGFNYSQVPDIIKGSNLDESLNVVRPIQSRWDGNNLQYYLTIWPSGNATQVRSDGIVESESLPAEINFCNDGIMVSTSENIQPTVTMISEVAETPLQVSSVGKIWLDRGTKPTFLWKTLC